MRELVTGGAACAVPGSSSSSSNPLGALANALIGSSSKTKVPLSLALFNISPFSIIACKSFQYSKLFFHCFLVYLPARRLVHSYLSDPWPKNQQLRFCYKLYFPFFFFMKYYSQTFFNHCFHRILFLLSIVFFLIV